jgi:hypothetical protein
VNSGLELKFGLASISPNCQIEMTRRNDSLIMMGYLRDEKTLAVQLSECEELKSEVCGSTSGARTVATPLKISLPRPLF